MNQRITENYFTDSEGNPAGGTTFGQGFCIGWQNGPLVRDGERVDPNGAFVEDIIKAARQRLSFYQTTKFACNENAVAMFHLQNALTELQSRTAKREDRGVEGTHEA